jgi:hypothetical protein
LKHTSKPKSAPKSAPAMWPIGPIYHTYTKKGQYKKEGSEIEAHFGHPDNSTCHAKATGEYTRDPKRKAGRGVPVFQIIPTEPSTRAAEEKVLLCDDNNEEGSPVAENGQEVGEDRGKVLAAGDTGDGVCDEYDERPEETGDLRERAAKGLDRERRGVGIRHVVGAEANRLAERFGE